MKFSQAMLIGVCLALSIADVRAQEGVVMESARDIPLAYDVDVVVVGGSTGAVSAAVAASKNGASVFLVEPFPYLGEDVTATLRLWLEPGEEPSSPLAKRIFRQRPQTEPPVDPGRMLDFTYEANLPSDGRHKDTDPPSLLSDGKWHRANTESVQYGGSDADGQGDVAITVDLGEPKDVDEAIVMVYHKNDFLVKSVTAHSSLDKQNWRQVAIAENKSPKQSDVNVLALPITLAVGGEARYLRFLVKKPPAAERVLLGEIIVVKQGPPRKVEKPKVVMATPMTVKKGLDDALLEAGVKFLYMCYPTEVLRDDEGNVAGIVMANRSGRQAVRAKVIIDATARGMVARMAGARRLADYPGGMRTFKRVVVGGEVQTSPGVSARKVGSPFVVGRRVGKRSADRTYDVIEYTLRIPLKDASKASWANAEQVARNLTYHPEQQFTSDVLFEVPPDPVKGKGSVTGGWTGVEKLDIAAFRPAGVSRMFVLGGCADIPREHAAKLLQPDNLIEMGTRIGVSAAKEAKELDTPVGAHLSVGMGQAEVSGDTHECLVGVRPTQDLPTVPAGERPLPVLGRYDVVIVGGGTSGAPAGIAAARQGARTLVVEMQHALGGVGTLGAITKYYHGYRGGFNKEIPFGSHWAVEQKAEWWRKELLKAGADIWFGTLGCGAFVNGGRVSGVVVATAQGRGVVLADVVVDSTGNADIAVSAGARSIWTDASNIALQGTGLPPRRLGTTYTNTDYTIVDETDLVDVWHLLVYAKRKFPNAFDLGKLVDTRERRRIVGDYMLTFLDQVNHRTYPDTIGISRTNFDTHGFTVEPYFDLSHPGPGVSFDACTPYRCLLPSGLDGMLVTGLGISAHRDAIPIIRMQPDLQNQGYAAGVAAAMAGKAGGTRKIDIRTLQQRLVEKGCLPESVLTDEDSFPLPDERIAEAVKSVKDGYKGVEVILAHREKALPLLREAYAKANKEDKLIYAHVLATLHDDAGLETLLAVVKGTGELDKGWNYRGMGQFGSNKSHLDSLIIALGRIGDKRAIPVIAEKMKLVTAESDFSHHRSMALALEMLGGPDAAEILARQLAKPGIQGHALTDVETAADADQNSPGGSNAVKTRRESLRELIYARALFRCGDENDLGKKILTAYTKDLRGHLARHAEAVLSEGDASE